MSGLVCIALWGLGLGNIGLFKLCRAGSKYGFKVQLCIMKEV